ncbi:hypothetical protein [Haloprofundus halobius]|uniref:hypothetical protein n=1 Tax=Haloprofundus halobius TaxID=2876194 RepID=UPI001CCCFFF6|nr:hypothetical protein [Haloprofundus halobius]
MSLPSSRRDALRFCGVALGVGIAGCVQSGPTDPADSTRNDSVSTDSPTSEPTAIPSSAVPDEEAKERALETEEAYITERLEGASCLTGWGATPTVTDEEATVTDRTADGVHVEVTHPYWYSAERQSGNETVVEEADGATSARYVVTGDDIRRDEGDDISPC